MSEFFSGEIIPVPQISRDVSSRTFNGQGKDSDLASLSLLASRGGKMTRAERRFFDPTRPKVEQKH